MPELHSYEVVIGLEVHAQLLTQTKLFCADTTAFGAPPNTQVSAISLGHPGTLPRLNREAIAIAVKLGLACDCQIVQHNYFARKNYFYPDLPKGYQISQHTTPVCRGGGLSVTADGSTHFVRLNRIHIEEDAGKSVHDENSDFSNIDYNRAGMPLLEIVTEPDIHSAAAAAAYVTALRKLVRRLGVCDGNMEQGSLRCDVNISVRPQSDPVLGTRVEIKNLNSIRFIKKAIEYESARLIDLHRNGQPIIQQTRGFDEAAGTTYAIRTKEDEDDYRYFPEPDLPPFFISDAMIEAVRKALPPSQEALAQTLVSTYNLSAYDAGQLADDDELSAFFLRLAALTSNAKAAANWLIGPVRNHLIAHDLSIGETGLQPEKIAELIALIDEGRISYGIAAQTIFPALLQNPSLDIPSYIETNGLLLHTDEGELDTWIAAALEKHSEKITAYKKGKKGLISLFVGEVMKLSGGKADARLVNQKIIDQLKA